MAWWLAERRLPNACPIGDRTPIGPVRFHNPLNIANLPVMASRSSGGRHRLKSAIIAGAVAGLLFIAACSQPPLTGCFQNGSATIIIEGDRIILNGVPSNYDRYVTQFGERIATKPAVTADYADGVIIFRQSNVGAQTFRLSPDRQKIMILATNDYDLIFSRRSCR